MQANLESITPAKAEKFLAKMGKQRPYKEWKAIEYARRMNAGEWRENGEPLIFNTKGEMINGQHRCHGVIISGVTVKMLVVTGVSSDDIILPTIDNILGGGRSGADNIAIAGYKNYSALAAAAKLLFRYETGSILDKSRVPSHAEIVELCQVHHRLPESVNYICGLTKLRAFASITHCSLVHYKSGNKIKSLADAFFAALADGTGLKAGDPIYLLRERLAKERRLRLQRAAGRATEAGLLTLLVKAWNMHATGRAGKLSWVAGEAIPKIASSTEIKGQQSAA